MKKAYLAGLLALALTAGCLSQSPTLPPPFSPTITPTKIGAELTLEAWRDAPPAVCTQLPPGVGMTVNTLSTRSVQVIVRGLKPGEEVSFEFAAQASGKSIRVSPAPAQEDGTVSETQGSLYAPQGSTTNVWTIKVIHPRGVGCEEVTFPTP